MTYQLRCDKRLQRLQPEAKLSLG